jgi:hypothetical protein
MQQNKDLTQGERARVAQLFNLLVERYEEQKEALAEGDRYRAIELEFEIKELLREKKRT